MADQIDIRLAFEAVARILGDREQAKITITSIKKREKEKKEEGEEGGSLKAGQALPLLHIFFTFPSNFQHIFSIY